MTGVTSERRFALVVATTDYLDPALGRLRAPAEDAAELRDLLADPDVGAFSVTSVINERAHQVRLSIEDFLSGRDPDDFLLLYLSCHGLVDVRRRLYFAARDTIKERLASSGVESKWLLDQLEDCRARRQVVILDCCFSGAFARGAKGAQDIDLGERLVGDGRGRVVLTASRGTEYSFEGDSLAGPAGARGSVFTTALIEGIRTGRADSDGDGQISVDDAYAYAFEQVRGSGAAQTPQRWLYGAEGSMVLARVPTGSDGQAEATDLPSKSKPLPGPHPGPGSAAPVGPTPPGAESRSPLRTKRTRLAAMTALAVAALAVTTVVILDQRHGPLPGPDSGSESDSSSVAGTLPSMDSPWRMKVVNEISVGNEGCSVTLTNEESGYERTWESLYDIKTLHVRQSGTFTYQVNDPGCFPVIPLTGAGTLQSVPFRWMEDDGDSPVFDSLGTVRVDIFDWEGTPTCRLVLVADSSGERLNTVVAAQDESEALIESNGPQRVFLEHTTCSAQVDSTP